MKTISKTVIHMNLAVLCLSAAIAGPARELPFHGVVHQVEEQIIEYAAMSVTGTATGRATVLGRFVETFEAEVNLLTGSAVGSARFTACDGSISTEIVGQGTSTDVPGQLIVTEEHTIVCGTGRFRNARGSFTVVRVYNEPLVSSGSFDGTIVLDHRHGQGNDRGNPHH